jgi:hypothetical protein
MLFLFHRADPVEPGNGFLEALTLPHVQVFSKEMHQITEKGFIDADRVEHEVDIIICATG